MFRAPDKISLVTLVARTSTIAMIAMVMPLGIDISGDGVVSLGAAISHAADKGKGNGRGGKGNYGSPNEPSLPVSVPKGDFGASAEPAGPDLTKQEEQGLISRGWL